MPKPNKIYNRITAVDLCKGALIAYLEECDCDVPPNGDDALVEGIINIVKSFDL